MRITKMLGYKTNTTTSIFNLCELGKDLCFISELFLERQRHGVMYLWLATVPGLLYCFTTPTFYKAAWNAECFPCWHIQTLKVLIRFLLWCSVTEESQPHLSSSRAEGKVIEIAYKPLAVRNRKFLLHLTAEVLVGLKGHFTCPYAHA